MKTKYPPFVIVTHNSPALNTAVQHLCFAHGITWFGGDKELTNLEAHNLSNCLGYSSRVESSLGWDGRDTTAKYPPAVKRFDARTDLAAFAEFLHNPPAPPKPPTELTLRSQDERYTVKIYDDKTEVGCQVFANADVLKLAEAIKARVKSAVWGDKAPAKVAREWWVNVHKDGEVFIYSTESNANSNASLTHFAECVHVREVLE